MDLSSWYPSASARASVIFEGFVGFLSYLFTMNRPCALYILANDNDNENITAIENKCIASSRRVVELSSMRKLVMVAIHLTVSFISMLYT